MKQTAANSYDYIVLGGGSAGCVIAARLSENTQASVLLLEAGGQGDDLFIKMPAGNGFLFGNPKFDWCYESTPQKELLNRRIYYPRGRGLGGSSIMNGMIYTRGDPLDYDSWNLPGWRHKDLLPYFKKSEHSRHRDNEAHGHSGPVNITQACDLGTLDLAFVEAAQQAGHCYNHDFNAGSQLGVGIIDVAVHKGQRQSAAFCYLGNAAEKPNLSISKQSMSLRINTHKHKAVSVDYIQGQDVKTAFCNGEIILSQGSFASPQLLMQSGIGPQTQLKQHDISVVLPLEGVGKNLQDHANFPLTYSCKDSSLTLARLQRLDRALKIGLEYLLSQSGHCSNPFWKTNLFQTINNTDTRADLQTYFTPMIVEESPEKINSFFDLEKFGSQFLVRGKKAGNGFQLDINLMHPDSTGEVLLSSNNPVDKPLINPNFLKEGNDKKAFIQAIQALREVTSQSAFDDFRGNEFVPGSQVKTDDALLQSIRQHLTTGHHPVGTCKMGLETDQSAVVDPHCRVIGIDKLRVVDGSIMPTIITGNTNAPIIAIAEKAADLILDLTDSNYSNQQQERTDEQSL